jgi:hypothetical protein
MSQKCQDDMPPGTFGDTSDVQATITILRVIFASAMLSVRVGFVEKNAPQKVAAVQKVIRNLHCHIFLNGIIVCPIFLASMEYFKKQATIHLWCASENWAIFMQLRRMYKGSCGRNKKCIKISESNNYLKLAIN